MHRKHILRMSTLVLLLTLSSWAQTGSILYNFTGSKDGANPKSKLVLDNAGNFYGTTTSGGANSLGAVFELTPSSRGGWLEIPT